MDTLTDDRRIIRAILSEFAAIPYAHGDLRSHAIFDTEGDHYLLVTTGTGTRAASTIASSTST